MTISPDDDAWPCDNPLIPLPGGSPNPRGEVMFADELRRAIQAAPRAELTKISALLWRAFAANQVSEEEADALSQLIEGRKALPPPQKPARRHLGSRPRGSTCLDGTAPPLGRLWSLAAGLGRAVHAGRGLGSCCG